MNFAEVPPRGLALSMAAPVTVVEAIMLSAARDGLRFRIRTAVLRDTEVPDLVARRLADLDRTAGALLHSTSWRFTGMVVLTYAALPDTRPSPHATRVPTTVVTSRDPLGPSPDRIHPGEVAAHACRHLAYLRHTNPLVAARAAEVPHLWNLIDRFRPAVAGSLTRHGWTEAAGDPTR